MARPILLSLSGGPGQDALSWIGAMPRLYRPLTTRYRIAALDQRGTDASHKFDCTSEGIDGLECARRRGPARAFYTTVHTVLDIEE